MLALARGLKGPSAPFPAKKGGPFFAANGADSRGRDVIVNARHARPKGATKKVAVESESAGAIVVGPKHPSVSTMGGWPRRGEWRARGQPLAPSRREGPPRPRPKWPIRTPTFTRRRWRISLPPFFPSFIQDIAASRNRDDEEAEGGGGIGGGDCALLQSPPSSPPPGFASLRSGFSLSTYAMAMRLACAGGGEASALFHPHLLASISSPGEAFSPPRPPSESIHPLRLTERSRS